MQIPRYLAEDHHIVSRNQPNCANRVIYCANTATSILAGDRPFIRLINRRSMLGMLRMWVITEGKKLYFHDFNDIEFSYTANLVIWKLRDPGISAVISVGVGSPISTEGFIATISSDIPVEFYWQYGSLSVYAGGYWNIDPAYEKKLLLPEFDPDACAGNIAVCMGEYYIIRYGDADSDPAGGSPEIYISGPDMCSDSHTVSGKHMLSEVPVYIGASRKPLGPLPEAYGSVLLRSKELTGIFKSNTPDPYIDAQLAVLGAEIDGAWYPPRTMHSNQCWNDPFVGWCNRFGNTLGGWTDRVFDELSFYFAHQNREDKLRGGQSDRDMLLTEAAPDSRFYGLGHIDIDQYMYNMQSQFFDQAIFAWRVTGDTRIRDILRPALELHTRWQDECFDPDCDGLYESYINTWPTDSVWYNGGGSCEETCYAYRSHTAAMELSLLAGDTKAADSHKAAIERIQKGFFNLLWLKDSGYPAMLLEKGGKGRLHRSAWLYNSFMPVDVDLLDPEQQAMCLWYSRWGLENIITPFGGRTITMSNWVPGIWSVRRNEEGECFQQAYAYFKAGFAEEGLDLLSGSIRAKSFDFYKPGQICSEPASLLARAVICGLHGYRPDYPNNSVVLAPQYPKDWKNASFETSYFKCSYSCADGTINYSFRISLPAEIAFRIPIRAKNILSVTGLLSFRIESGFDCRVLIAELGSCNEGKIEIKFSDPLDLETITINTAPGSDITLSESITDISDPQEILDNYKISGGKAVIKLRRDIDGNHMLFLKCRSDGIEYNRIVSLDISPAEAALAAAAKQRVELRGAPVFESVNMEHCLNADVRTIYRQKYLSPRHDTVHLAIGIDGYSPWTFAHWKNAPPDIKLSDSLSGNDPKGYTVYSAAGVPFRWGGGERNIAFTSLWDNWPGSVNVPVGRSAQAVYLLVCGSTNPMQCGIANAAVRFKYADGTEEILDLINPDNFWSLAAYTCAPSSSEQGTVNDYNYRVDGYCLPEKPPETIQLGENCRAVVLGYNLKPDVCLESITFETLSQEVVIGLMSVTLVR